MDFTESIDGDSFVEQMERTGRFAEAELEYWGLAVFGPKQPLTP